MFVLATTEAHKVPATIVSRCQTFNFHRIPYQLTRDRLAAVAAAEGLAVEPAVLERLALVARGGLRDALSLLDQLESFAGGEIDMTVARAALSLPAIEAVRGVIDGMSRRDASAVMAVLSDAAEGGADMRQFAEELIVNLRALLLLNVGADARLSDELPADEVDWLRQRAPVWLRSTLSTLLQTLSEALARTRDAAQFQVQLEVAILTACDPDSVVPAPRPASVGPVPDAVPRTAAARAPVRERTTARPSEPSPSDGPTVIEPPATPVETDPGPPPPAAVASASENQTPRVSVGDASLGARWSDVVEQVRNRNPLLAPLIERAVLLGVDNGQFVIGFASDFNRKSADSPKNRRLIETVVERVYGTPYRLRCTLAAADDSGASLLDDPVINYAQRTFGGEPKRL